MVFPIFGLPYSPLVFQGHLIRIVICNFMVIIAESYSCRQCLKGFYFCHDTKVTKGLGLKPPKAEKPGDIPKIRKLAALKQYEFLNGLSPGFSPSKRFFRQRPWGLRGVPGSVLPHYRLFAQRGRKQRGSIGGRLCRALCLTPLARPPRLPKLII